MLSKNQEKWLKEGRGQGELADYKPWIKISDISSSGRSHRVFGHKTRRTHLLVYYRYIMNSMLWIHLFSLADN